MAAGSTQPFSAAREKEETEAKKQKEQKQEPVERKGRMTVEMTLKQGHDEKEQKMLKEKEVKKPVKPCENKKTWQKKMKSEEVKKPVKEVKKRLQKDNKDEEVQELAEKKKTLQKRKARR